MLYVAEILKDHECAVQDSVKSVPTQRAVDWRESAASRSNFFASGFFCSQAKSTPPYTQATQAVGLSGTSLEGVRRG